MMVSNRTMWAVVAVAVGAGLAAVLLPPARGRWRALENDQSSRVDEASEDSFPARPAVVLGRHRRPGAGPSSCVMDLSRRS